MVSLRRTDGDSTISISSSAETSSRIRSESFTEPLLPCSKDCSNSIEMLRTGSLVVGLIIRIVPPIRKAMIGDNALLRLIDNSASLLGYDHPQLLRL
ncbi:hypothetical protein WN943_016192 [Citrus x changshan-huyou]